MDMESITMRGLRFLKSKSGQALVESTLLMGVVIVCWLGATKILREQGVFQNVFGKSWAKLSNVIEFGIPVVNRNQAANNHPAAYQRHSTRVNN
jgi:hypothetical protein